MSAHDLPDEIYLGKKAGQWPLFVFENEAQATRWMQEQTEGRSLVEATHRPLMFKVEVVVLEELQLVPPTPAKLAPKGVDGE